MLIVLSMTCVLAPITARAGEERIANMTTRVVSNTELTVSAVLIRWDNEKIREDLENGIPKDLFYYILLKKRIPGWIDEEVFSVTIKHTIKYDILKKQYLITTRMKEETTQKTVDTFEEMAKLISIVDHAKIGLVRSLKTRHTYYISLKAEMRASTIPFYLEYILFFIPRLELDTPWASSAPFYALEKAR